MTTPIERRQFLIGAGAMTVAGAAFAAQPRRSLADFSHSSLGQLVPTTVGGWMGADDTDMVPEQVDGSIDHGKTISRRYVASNAPPVMLVVSYHGPKSPDLKVHRPETCYMVAGFEGGHPSPTQVKVHPQLEVPSVLFTARRETRNETVLYWTRVGNRFPQSLSDQRLDFFGEALHGILADGLLMRASTVGDRSDISAEVLRGFAAALVQAATPQGRDLLLGPVAATLGRW